jgi:membrane protein DedA with SNARE-associated domain
MTEHVPAFVTALQPVVETYGYLAVGGLILLEDFGIPAPGETVLIAASFFAGINGNPNILLVALVGFIGAVIGDNIGFAIGTFGGRPLLERYGKLVFIKPHHIDTAQGFFNRNGGKVVIIARFIEGLRQLNGILAGISDMHWTKFLTFNAIGAGLWVGLWTSVGYFGGSHIDTFLKYQLYFTIAVVAGLLVFIGYKLIKRRKK